MNRRTFVSWSVLALGAALWRARGRPETRAELSSELQSLFSAPAEAIALGHRYLALHPAMADRDLLMRDLGMHADRGVLRSPLAAIVRQARERDFRDGNMVVLEGWVLARSEVAVCALLALT